MCAISCSRIEIPYISIPPPQVKGLQREAWAYHFLRVWYFPPLLFPFFYFKAVRATLFITNEWVERGKEIKIPLVQGCQCPVLSKKNSGFRRKIFLKEIVSWSVVLFQPPLLHVCVCVSLLFTIIIITIISRPWVSFIDDRLILYLRGSHTAQNASVLFYDL